MPALKIKPFSSYVKDITGQKFGRLIVIGFSGIDKYGKAQWKCKCACGKEVIAQSYLLRSGTTSSCGCLRREVTAKKNYKHGHTTNGVFSTEYHSWNDMKTRCYNKHRHNYKYYGGRGIKVCKRWRDSFSDFLQDMGRKPSPKHSIDRINNDGNYEPGNCRWATHSQQMRNRRPQSAKTKA